MLSFFRRLINSRVGVIITFVVLAVIALAFAAGDVTGLASNAGGLLGNSLASVGSESVSPADVRQRAQGEVRAQQQQQPGFDMAQYVAAGGVESLVTRSTNSLALNAFGADQGLAVSRAVIGSELRAIPAFRGLNGQFDQQTYERAIALQGLNDRQVQRDVASDVMARFLLVPTVGATQVPRQVALPYAELLLEKRAGQVALIPAALMPAPAAPTDAEIADWYRRNVARYTVPERRVIRYALVGPEQVKAQAAPNDAEIAAYYKAHQADYAAREQRDVSFVTVLSEQAGKTLAAKVKGGATIDAAARAAGLEPRSLKAQEKTALVTQLGQAAADAVAATPAGGIAGPARGQIGFIVAKVDKVTPVAGRTLAQARDEIVDKLTTQKTADALGKANSSIDDALTGDASFAEVATDNKLTAQTTPPLLQNGTQFGSTQPADATLAPIVAAAFAAEEGDTATIVPMGQDGSFAVVALDRIVRAAPLPLAQVRQRLIDDIAADRRDRAARDAARAIAAKANGGMTLAAAIAASGVKVPAPQPVSALRAEISRAPEKARPVLAMLFSMAKGNAKPLASPDPATKGWLVVKLDTLTPGDVRSQPEIVAQTRAEIGRGIGTEYAQQFANAVAAQVGVKRHPEAIAQLKKELSGQGGSDQ